MHLIAADKATDLLPINVLNCKVRLAPEQGDRA